MKFDLKSKIQTDVCKFKYDLSFTCGIPILFLMFYDNWLALKESYYVKSSALGRCSCDIELVIFKLMSKIYLVFPVK